MKNEHFTLRNNIPMRLVIATAVLAALTITGCGTADSTSQGAGCDAASVGVTTAIKDGISHKDGANNRLGISVGRTAIVHDPEHDVYYAAAELQFGDGAKDVAVWETSKNDGTGYMHSAEAMAKLVTNYPQMYANAATPGVKAAKACLK